LNQQPEGVVSDTILRIIQEQTRRLGGQAFAAVGIPGKEIPEMKFADFFAVCGEGLPRGKPGKVLLSVSYQSFFHFVIITPGGEL
jgi:hypothetical protein